MSHNELNEMEMDPYSPLLSILRPSEHPKISLNVHLIDSSQPPQNSATQSNSSIQPNQTDLDPHVDPDPFQNKRILAVISNVEGNHEEAWWVTKGRDSCNFYKGQDWRTEMIESHPIH